MIGETAAINVEVVASVEHGIYIAERMIAVVSFGNFTHTTDEDLEGKRESLNVVNPLVEYVLLEIGWIIIWRVTKGVDVLTTSV